MDQCRQQEKDLTMVQSSTALAHQRLHTHLEKQILARLSIGDLSGAALIAKRLPAGPARNEILRAPSALPDTTAQSVPDIRAIVHRLHMSSERAPDVRAVPMRLVHQDVFEELLAAADTIPESRLAVQSPPPVTEDLTDEDVRNLDTTASWMCNARGATLTESDQQRVGHKIERALAELRRHRDTLRVTCPTTSETSPSKDLTRQQMSDLLSGYSGVAGTDMIERMVHEIRRHREELTERRQLDAVRRAEIDELVARRQADLCAEERAALAGLKQLLESAAYQDHKDGPVPGSQGWTRVDHTGGPPTESTMSSAGIYIASRAYRAARWRQLRDIEGWQITSSWIDEAGTGESTDLGNLWTRIEAEIAKSKLLILYVETEDFPLKGALIEVGMALATPIPICIVAPGVVLNPVSFRPLGSWVRHPRVTFCDTLTEAQAHCQSTEVPK